MRAFLGALFAVLSAFAGIRKGAARAPHLRLRHYVAAGLLMVGIFIAILLAVVNAVV